MQEMFKKMEEKEEIHTVELTNCKAHLSSIIKHYLKNDLYGEESSKDVVCIAKDL